MNSVPIASIIVRAFNENRHIGQLFEELFSQQTDFPFEVILVDSGSTDGTLETAQTFTGKHPLRIISIPPESFTFGYALNVGIEAARGKFCAMISAHCHPLHTQWLSELIRPLRENETVALVYGKQRGGATTRFSEHQIFQKLFPEKSIPDYQLPFCNNANSAIRKSIWVTEKFDEKITGLEDVAWANHVRTKGYKISYQAEAGITHIHEEVPKQIYRRYYREALAYREIFTDVRIGLRKFLKLFLLNTLEDYFEALRQGSFFKNFLSIPQFRLYQYWGTYKAYQYHEPISREMHYALYYPRFFRPKANGQALPRAPLLPSAVPESQKVFDISRALSADLPVWPGAKRFEMNEVKTHAKDRVYETHLSFNTHTGTHIDAPYHFVEGGSKMKDLPLERLIGSAFVMEWSGKHPIDVRALTDAHLPEGTKRLLFKTTNSSSFNSGDFVDDFVALTPQAAQYLIEKGIELVGIDGPSIQCFHDHDNSTHEILLKAGVVILEGLDLDEVTAGDYHLCALPLKIPQAEGAPVRAILTKGKLQ